MNVVVRLTEREELKALPILLRHSVGRMLRDGSYVISAEAVRALRDAGVKFVSSETNPPFREGAGAS
jgi:hypothetical protein